ncbi:tapasin-like [Brachyistius frenatus]|uniref:tapasin-like n=1 Tax=Brachyistius frenatus TaxID=100188 RepID=UPI0037E81A78
MCLMLKILVYLYLYTGVLCTHQIPWLPCEFIDERLSPNTKGDTDTQHIRRDAMLQFGQTGDAPVNPDAITFLLTGSKLDLRRYVEPVNADQLVCEIRSYSEGGHIHWPVQAPQDYNRWFSCTLRHIKDLFTVTAFLRHPSDQHPAQQDYRSWPAIRDKETLTATVAMVIKTNSPVVKARLGAKKELHCQFGIDHEGPNVTVEWHRRQQGAMKKLLSSFHRSGQTQRTGGSGPGLQAVGDASYTVPVANMTSEGTYVCSVSANALLASLDVNLHIEEPPRVSLNVGPILSLQEGEGQRVVCEAQGYYPLDVEFVWSKKASGQRAGAPLPKDLENISFFSHKHNRDKTYSLSAFFYLHALLRNSGSEFTCSVSHQSLTEHIRKSFILDVEDPVSWMFYLTSGFSVVVLLAFLFKMRCYRYSARQRSVPWKPF